MSGRRLTLDDVARRPEPGMDAPGAAVFAPDGKSITFLWSADGSLVRSLWRQDLTSGERTEIALPRRETTREETLSREDHLQRERTRTSELGVTSFGWATDAPEPTLLVPMGGRLFVAWGSAAERGVHELEGIEGASGALLSPDGSLVSFTMDGDLYVAPIRGGAPRRITADGEPGVFNGLAEFVAAEELDRHDGAWWSTDSRSVAFARVDERHVPPITIRHERGSDPEDEVHHYPFPGGPNAHVSLQIAAVDGPRVVAVDLGMDDDDYLARVIPHPDGGWLVSVLPRDQRTLRWHRVGADGTDVHLWTATGDPWITLDQGTRVLPDGRILSSTEGTGFRHLELRSPDGELERSLTAGEWVVTGVVGIDQSRGEVLFTGTRDGVLERHLYAVPLDASEPASDPERLTTEPGWHAVTTSADGAHWIDTRSDLEHAPRVTVASRAGDSTLIHAPSTTATAEHVHPPEIVRVVAADGRTHLNAAIYRAANGAARAGPAPAVVWVYGGPHSQYVKNAWEMTVHGLRQFLAQSGASVIVVDNRGTAFQGRPFESAVNGRLGRNEVADQAAVVRQLAERGEVDPGRVGIVGGSYGGFMTILAMAFEPELFSTGVAIAPVAEWTGYDTAYTERYLGLPSANPEAYRASSALTHVAAVRGDLLLIHGTADENVHLRHSERLVQAFRQAGREIELVRVPEQRHRMRGAAIRERDRRTIAHLLRGLGLPPPADVS